MLIGCIAGRNCWEKSGTLGGISLVRVAHKEAILLIQGVIKFARVGVEGVCGRDGSYVVVRPGIKVARYTSMSGLRPFKGKFWIKRFGSIVPSEPERVFSNGGWPVTVTDCFVLPTGRRMSTVVEVVA